MRKLFFVLFFVFSIGYSQVPQKMSHRGTAYDSSGTVLKSTTIGLKVSILNESANGKLVYSETHNVTTNENGQYSIEIGVGTKVSTDSFSSIDWSQTEKYLKIEIDVDGPLNNGTIYSVSGASQLMSVPYALFSLNSMSGGSSCDVTVNSINDLRTYTNPAPFNRFCVKYHSNQSDIGGGVFIWVPEYGSTENPWFNIHIDSSVLPNPSDPPKIRMDDDGCIIQNSNLPSTNKGRYIRLVDGLINIQYYGATGNYQNDGEKIQKAIDYAADNVFNGSLTKGNTVFLPTGSYLVYNQLVLKSGVSIKGESFRTTQIIAGYPDAQDAPANSSYGGHLMIMDHGRIEGCNISDLSISGNVVADINNHATTEQKTKGCFYFESVTTSNYGVQDGGLWNCTFKNLRISGFNGSIIGIHGASTLSPGNDDFTRPNQFCIFENVHAIRQKSATHTLHLTGEIGQFTFINSAFGAKGITNGGVSLKGMNVVLANANGGFNTSQVASFINCTFQDAEYGIYLSHAESVKFDTCWFENLDVAVFVKDAPDFNNGKRPSFGISIDNCRFANAAGFGSLNITNAIGSNSEGYYGKCIIVDNSVVSVKNNYVTISNPGCTTCNLSQKNFIYNNSGKGGIYTSGNSFQDPILSTTVGLVPNLTITNNSIDLSYNTYCNVDGGTNALINQIISSSLPSEKIVLTNSGTGNISFDTTGNLSFSTPTVTLAPNRTAEFIKRQLPNGIIKYQLVSTENVSELTDSNWINVNSTDFNTNVTPAIANFSTISPVRYRKKNGIVYLDGVLKGGATQTNGTTYKLITLPQGYRPSRKTSFTITRAGNTTGTTPTSTVVGRVDIDIDGSVYGVNYSTIWSNLSGISFVVD